MKYTYQLTSNLGERLFILIVLAIIGSVCFYKYVILIILWVMDLILFGFIWIRRTYELNLYPSGFTLGKCFNKVNPDILIDYNNIAYVKLKVPSVRGEYTLTVCFKENFTPKRIDMVYRNYVPRKELKFLKTKSVRVIVEGYLKEPL